MQAALGGLALSGYISYKYRKNRNPHRPSNFYKHLTQGLATAATLNAYESMPPLPARFVEERNRQQRDRRARQAYRPSMSIGGNYESTSAGRFGPCRNKTTDATSAYSRQGAVRELTVGGVIQDSNCVYLGHSDLSIDSTFYQVVLALTRAFSKLVDLISSRRKTGFHPSLME